MRWKIAGCVIAFALLIGPVAYSQDQHAQVTEPSTNPVQRIRIGGNVAQAKIIHLVKPVYPKDAKKDRIQGTILLHAIVAKDGSVQDLQYISGPRELMRAAMDAVRQWRYAPTLLVGQPVEVDTTISVVFTLNGK
jgi:TonB family protein